MMRETDSKPLLSLKIRTEPDIVLARQRAREIAGMVGLRKVDQVSLATAVSEIARNAHDYGGGGTVAFALDLHSRPQFLWVHVTDHGPGIPDLQAVLNGQFGPESGLGIGVSGTRRLADRFEISSSRSEGTSVRFGKALPGSLDMRDLRKLGAQLTEQPPEGMLEALRQQNQDLVQTLETLRSHEIEMDARKSDLERLNLELDETNRGVVALYAELEERAIALRRSDQLKSEFVWHVSHEFRTPLNSIMALSHLLLRRTDGDLTTEQEKQVAFIREAAMGLTEMVNDLLDLAKVESGKSEIRRAPVEISQIVGAVRALMRPLAVNDSVTLTFEESPVGSIVTDESKVGQILRNLVSNALKFTEKGGVRVSASYSEDRDWIRFSVQDTGIGIAPEHLEVVFQEFSQVDHSIQGRVKGTGLGLSLSRKLAGLLGGTLEVTSQRGRGSTFVLKLPARPVVGDSQPDVHQTPEAAILIVDDEDASRYVCRQLFRGSRYRIIESDAPEAAERARFERPSLIILDLMMPGRNGFEVLDDLKSDPLTCEIPVFIHTSKSLTDADLDRLSGRHLGLLPKSGSDRREAFLAIRTVLADPDLFASEPEFMQNTD
jgi:signal transduction histidine kinase/CheY-like chemotaxis protein